MVPFISAFANGGAPTGHLTESGGMLPTGGAPMANGGFLGSNAASLNASAQAAHAAAVSPIQSTPSLLHPVQFGGM